MNTDRLIVFSLALGSVGLYASFLPNVATIALDYQSDAQKSVLREAEFIGTAHLLVVAAIASYISKSSLPLLLAVLLGASMFATYEYALMRVVAR